VVGEVGLRRLEPQSRDARPLFPEIEQGTGPLVRFAGVSDAEQCAVGAVEPPVGR
jgi:hypothetical protein